MTDRATVRPPKPESKIPIGASTAGTTSKGMRRTAPRTVSSRTSRRDAVHANAGTNGLHEDKVGVWRTSLPERLDQALRDKEAAEEALRDLQARVDNAQQLAHMGDYDWEIATDTNTWSDQLFRIYGHEPGAFKPNYEQFLSMIHPDDQERIKAIHQQAYATGEPYEMIERIVRPDGEVRYLSSNGQVVTDENGTPIRMRGTCIDITERVLAERSARRTPPASTRSRPAGRRPSRSTTRSSRG